MHEWTEVSLICLVAAVPTLVFLATLYHDVPALSSTGSLFLLGSALLTTCLALLLAHYRITRRQERKVHKQQVRLLVDLQ